MNLLQFATLVRPKNQPTLFALYIFIFYFTAPACIYSYNNDGFFLKLAGLGLISSGVIQVSNIFFTNRTKILSRVPIKSSVFTWLTMIIFCLFIIVTSYTASSIPILKALTGYSASELSDSREQFLKGREGIFSVLVFLNAILTTTFVPYILVLNFLLRKRIKFLIIGLFAVYSILFLSKAFFLRWALPLASFYTTDKLTKGKQIKLSAIIITSLLLIICNIFLAKMGNMNSEEQDYFDDVGYYFSSDFTRELNQSSGGKFLIWRAVSVPIFTAVDSIKVFNDYYQNDHLHGATNGTLSLLLSQTRVRFERIVFAYQYRRGFETGTKSSNAVFFIEAYVNFGITGIVIFSIVVSWLLVNFGHSSNYALSSISPLLVFFLFNGGLLGLLLGNGVVFFLICYFYFSSREKTYGAKTLSFPKIFK